MPSLLRPVVEVAWPPVTVLRMACHGRTPSDSTAAVIRHPGWLTHERSPPRQGPRTAPTLVTRTSAPRPPIRYQARKTTGVRQVLAHPSAAVPERCVPLRMAVV